MSSSDEEFIASVSSDSESAVDASEAAGSEDSSSDFEPVGPPPAKRATVGRRRAAPARRVVAGRGRGRGRCRGRGRAAAAAAADPTQLEPGWSRSEDVAPPRVHEFRESTGPTTPLPPSAQPLEFVLQLLGADLFEKLAEATNMNAVAKAPPPPDRANVRLATSDAAWRPTTAEEMKAFIAINLVMGIKELSEYRDFWSNNPVLHDHFISPLLTRNRYEKLCTSG